LYAKTGQKRFVEQTFVAAEDGRAASLRALWAGRDLTKTLPAEYWEALADRNKLEAGLVSDKHAVDMPALRRLRLKVEELETRASLDLPHDQGSPDLANGSLLERTRKTLRPTEAYLGFHLGTDESCLWVISREGFEFLRLPPRAYFAENVARLAKAVRENSPEAVSLGKRLYSEIIGPSRILADKPTWILAPDGPLFELPFAALGRSTICGGTSLPSDCPRSLCHLSYFWRERRWTGDWCRRPNLQSRGSAPAAPAIRPRSARAGNGTGEIGRQRPGDRELRENLAVPGIPTDSAPG
jgi:hypothetical protein